MTETSTDNETTTRTTNFLGIPVEGEISQGERRMKQRPLEEFAPLLQAVLDDPSIVSFGWHQYTPYFNDGDACIFRAGGVWVQTDQDEKTEDYNELLEVGYGSTLGSIPGKWVNGSWKEGDYVGPDEARYRRCHDLAWAVESGEFDDILIEAFGDHAEIAVTREAIQINFYSHD